MTRRKKHTPIGHDETPELLGPPSEAPERSSNRPSAGVELETPPPSAPERAGPMEPRRERPPVRSRRGPL